MNHLKTFILTIHPLLDPVVDFGEARFQRA